MTININPMLTTTAGGSFSTDSTGFIQGTALNDPTVRNLLSGGVLDSAAVLPMWGGIAISEDVPTPYSASVANSRNTSLGGTIVRAPDNASITGFSVFDQNHAAIVTPTSEVPLSAGGQMVNFYRLGSNARIAVACDPSLISLDGGLITQQVSWDFVNQRLIPFSASYPQTTITNAVWSSTSGGQIDFTVSSDLTADINAGDDINVAQVVNTGGSSTSAFNGAWTVVSITSTHIIVSAPSSISLGTYASGGVVLAGGGALNVRVLEVKPDGNMTVNYNSTTGQATWNRSGSVAIILI